MNRRDFIRYCLASGLSFPVMQSWANSPNKPSTQHTLILIELQGGNDGLNTVIPFTDDLYHEFRPTLALQENEIIKLNKQLALHHSLESIMPIWEQNNLSIMLGVGYQNPVLSHFRSIEIWNTASKSNEYLENGWLAKTLNQHKDLTINGLVLGGTYGPLQGSEKVIQIQNIDQFLKQSQNQTAESTEQQHPTNPALQTLLNTQHIIDQAAESLRVKLKLLQAPTAFAKNAFAQQMALATRVIQSNLNIPAIKVRLGSFDTHANQKPNHARLLKTLADAIFATEQALSNSGHWNTTTLMTYSEFGRRAKENGSKGTDHGTAAPHFIIGGNIQGGFKGQQPKLSELEKNNLKYTTDFKKVYHSALI